LLLPSNENPYLAQVAAALPRLLALFDTDPVSPTLGVGDRFSWAWKLIDFHNGTFQGAAHGLARLLAAGLLPRGISETAVRRRIEAIFAGTRTITRRDGSLEEAFPYEASYCVTALVAYDLLSAIELLREAGGPEIPDALGVVAPMIAFLERSDETHALISNHLATAAAALYKWAGLTGKPAPAKGRVLVDRILAHQSSEGWFREYEGADPGYQSLCTHYLADLNRLRPELGLAGPLADSVRFLAYFAHPDGSFGGLYGSRNTRFFYPGGVELLAAASVEARALSAFMRQSIATQKTVTLAAMDDHNLIPMFNSYCLAAASYSRASHAAAGPELPAIAPGEWTKRFPECGLFVAKGEDYYTVIACKKGGVTYHFVDGKAAAIDAGAVASGQGEALYSTQAYDADAKITVSADAVVVEAPFVRLSRHRPTPAAFICLRLLNVTVMRFEVFNALIKKLLVRLLITGKVKSPARNRRTITLGRGLKIADALQGDAKALTPVSVTTPFYAIHMASQGYWQSQDDQS
jgi:hypothetical protein